MSIDVLITVICALATGAKWVYEYAKRAAWEKSKFLLDQIERFQADSNVIAMQKMLDWTAITVEIGDDSLRVDEDLFYNSLYTHDKVHKFSKEEAKLRSVFDYYFDYLTKFIILIDSGLIEKQQLKLFLDYWFQILAGESKSKSTTTVNQIHNYLNFYGYTRLLEFLETEY